MKTTVTAIFILLLTLLNDGCAPAVKKYSSLEQDIDSLLSSGDIVGFSACIVQNKEIIWFMNRGLSDIENNVPVTEKTVFQLASLSKTITGCSLMTLFDKGLFDLDDDINKYLPFSVRNPNYPELAITIRMLLTHTSSLTDNRSYINELYGNGDQRNVAFEEIIKNCFDPSGNRYSTENFLKSKPGDKWRYCNLNYVIVARLVEKLSQESFSDYTRETLFTPLEMPRTGWFYSDFDTADIAVQYENDIADKSKKIRIPQYSWPGFPDGSLKTSPGQFANFIIMLTNNGRFNGRQILKPETVNEILQQQGIRIPKYKIIPPIVDMGLSWMITEGDSIRYLMHGGEGSGISTLAFFNPIDKKAVIIFLTGQYLREDGAFASDPKRYSSILFNLFLKYLR